jgi:hypothetical protein
MPTPKIVHSNSVQKVFGNESSLRVVLTGQRLLSIAMSDQQVTVEA